jgi:hypothetical protein
MTFILYNVDIVILQSAFDVSNLLNLFGSRSILNCLVILLYSLYLKKLHYT